MDQTRVKRRWDDIIPPKRQFATIGHGNFVRNIFAGQFRQRVRTGNLHFIVDGAGVDVQGTAEQIGKAKHVVDLVRIVAAPCCDDCVGADFMGFFGCDFWIRVCHRKDHRVISHGSHHILSHSTLGRHAKKHVCVFHRLFQGAQICFDGMGRFPLVHAFGAALVNHAFGVAHDTVFVTRAHRFQQFKTRDPRRTCAVQNDFDVLDLFP